MKRKAFIKQLVNVGCYLKRHGAKHDVYLNPATGKKATVPRHPEINELLCKIIKKQLGISL